MVIIGYIIAFIVGMFFGIVSSCILLAQKNLERAKAATDNIGTTINAAMNVYKEGAEKIDAEEEITEVSEA